MSYLLSSQSPNPMCNAWSVINVNNATRLPNFVVFSRDYGLNWAHNKTHTTLVFKQEGRSLLDTR